MSEQVQDLTPSMQEMMAQMACMQAKIDSLEAQSQIFTQPNELPKKEVSTSRRRMLRRLAGGLVAGLAAGGLVIAQPKGASANYTNNPTTNGLNGRAGMLITPPGATVTGTLSGGPTKVGLVVNGDATFDVGAFTPTVNAAILAYTANNGSAIVGQTQTGTAVYGQSDSNFGVVGRSTSGTAVYGVSTSGTGVYGNTSAPNGSGVFGNAPQTGGIGVGGSGEYIGVSGQAKIGVKAYGTQFGVHATDLSGTGYAGYFNGKVQASTLQVGYILGTPPASTRVSVIGAENTSGNSFDLSQLPANHVIAVYGNTPTSITNGYAGYFDGNAKVTGVLFAPNISATQITATTISASQIYTGAKFFKIDHPLDPANKYLYHTSVESPDMMNIYNGNATLDEQGEATVEMPDWFEALNSDFRYQLTCLGQFSQVYISEKMVDRRFKIAGGLPGQEISWLVTGIRQDAFANVYRSPVEEDKPEDDKGTYLHPELFNQPEEMSVHPKLTSKVTL